MCLTLQFETHLTLDASDPHVLIEVAEWAGAHQFKWTHIVLDAGCTPSQPMITFWGTGDLATQHTRARLLSLQLAELKASVVRIKIETDADAAGMLLDTVTGDGYFENHLKLLLAADADLAELSDLVAPHGAKLSRNARRVRTDGAIERFVTQRTHGADLRTSKASFDRLVDVVRGASIEIVDIEQEFVVFDSCLALDSGWLLGSDR